MAATSNTYGILIMSDVTDFLVLVETARTLRQIKYQFECDENGTLSQNLATIKNSKESLWRLEILCRKLDKTFQIELLSLTNGLRGSLGRPDIAAEMAMQDGFEDQAIDICKLAIEETLSRWRHRIDEYEAKAMALAQLVSDDGILCSDIEAEIGMEANGFFRLSNDELNELLGRHGAKITLPSESTLTPLHRRLLDVMLRHERRATFNELREAWPSDVTEETIAKTLKRLRNALPRSQWYFEISMANWEIVWHKKGQAVP